LAALTSAFGPSVLCEPLRTSVYGSEQPMPSVGQLVAWQGPQSVPLSAQKPCLRKLWPICSKRPSLRRIVVAGLPLQDLVADVARRGADRIGADAVSAAPLEDRRDGADDHVGTDVTGGGEVAGRAVERGVGAVSKRADLADDDGRAGECGDSDNHFGLHTHLPCGVSSDVLDEPEGMAPRCAET
jgi:hypothetical protein